MNTEEKFDNDVRWMLEELKREYFANSYSDYKAEFLIVQKSKDEPDERSQRRILKMLSDRKVITLSAIYHRNNSTLNSVLEIQGSTPIGYRLQIIQPSFDEMFEQVVKQKIDGQIDHETNTYFITLKNRQVMLNGVFPLSAPNFNSENANFIECIIEKPNLKLSRADIEKEIKKKLKKSFRQIVRDLGFKGEISKLFFDASKTAVQFRNYVPVTKLSEFGVVEEKLVEEMALLGQKDEKGKEVERKKKK
jgi:hypothetical protein